MIGPPPRQRCPDPPQQPPGPAGTESGGSGAAGAAVPASPAWRVVAVLAGFREPIVAILLAIAFFTAISGKPVDGVLMLIVAMSLAWDAGRRASGGGATSGGSTGGAAGADSHAGAASRRAGSQRRLVLAIALLAGGAAYAAVVGTFSRYSWPATAGIISLGTVVVLVGWHGPVTRRPVPGRLPAAGTALWGLLLVAGGIWELFALLKQQTLIRTSYAHPTISALTDPVLATAGGRSAVLAAWLLIGWYLVRR